VSECKPLKTGKSVPSAIRTSDGMFFSRGQDDVIADIERRLAEWTHVPVPNGSAASLLPFPADSSPFQLAPPLSTSLLPFPPTSSPVHLTPPLSTSTASR